MSAGTTEARMPAPYSYFIALSIGDLHLGNSSLAAGSKDPQVIQSLKITRLISGVVKNEETGAYEATNFSEGGQLYKEAVFTLTTVIDPRLEEKILRYISNNATAPLVYFRYGYVNGISSPMYSGIITNMSLSADMYTINLTVKWSSVGNKYMEIKQPTIDYIAKKHKKTPYTTYSDLITDIAKSQGWSVGKIEPTTPVDPNTIEFPELTMSILEYINQKIVPQCMSTRKEGNYKSFFKIVGGTEKYYFVPSEFLTNGSINIVRNFNFIVRMLPNGNVISFSPVLTDGVAVAGQMQVGGSDYQKNTYGVITKDTKELVEVSYELTNSTPNPGLVNPSSGVIFASKSSVNTNSPYSDVLNYAEAVIKDDFSAYCYSIASNPRAEMVVLGDPELNILDMINILPMYPANSPGSGGMMHPSGGTYQITDIEDNISTEYTTTLKMIKVKTMNLSGLEFKTIKPEPVPLAAPEIYKVGDRVWFKGATQYVSSYPGSKGYNNVKNKPGWAKITIINKKFLDENGNLKTPGAHPYHLVYEDWKETHVYGWVDVGTFSHNKS